MPAGETTSTNPIGWVSAIFQPSGSRVCDIVWLDADLFQSSELVALPEEGYTRLSAEAGREIKPGVLGEQLVIREMDFAAVQPGRILQIGDARVKVLESGAGFLKLQLIEEGLVEPGAPIK